MALDDAMVFLYGLSFLMFIRFGRPRLDAAGGDFLKGLKNNLTG
ncbi:hypothetical protein [Paradesulfitobacterium ferrireducens]|nr:hypothetical protein [Paradesulfitobacterium ferrireducens]